MIVKEGGKIKRNHSNCTYLFSNNPQHVDSFRDKQLLIIRPTWIIECVKQNNPDLPVGEFILPPPELNQKPAVVQLEEYVPEEEQPKEKRTKRKMFSKKTVQLSDLRPFKKPKIEPSEWRKKASVRQEIMDEQSKSTKDEEEQRLKRSKGKAKMLTAKERKQRLARALDYLTKYASRQKKKQ